MGVFYILPHIPHWLHHFTCMYRYSNAAGSLLSRSAGSFGKKQRRNRHFIPWKYVLCTTCGNTTIQVQTFHIPEQQPTDSQPLAHLFKQNNLPSHSFELLFLPLLTLKYTSCKHTEPLKYILSTWLVMGFIGFVHVSEAGYPAADATSDSDPDHLPPALKQSARCSAVRGGPARRTSHPGEWETGAAQRLGYILPTNIPWIAIAFHRVQFLCPNTWSLKSV